MNHNCAYIPTHHLICDSDILGAVRLQAVDSPDAVATQVWRNYCLALKPFLLLLKNPNRPQEILWHFLNYKSMERIADTPPSIICTLMPTNITDLSPLAGPGPHLHQDHHLADSQLGVKASPKVCCGITGMEELSCSNKTFSPLTETPNGPQEILWHFLNYKSTERTADFLLQTP